jgi:peptidoglycan biosynthesis protein MviN/MurJ (putative lipid II flippase)
MSDDIAQTVLCLAFTAPAVAILVFAIFRKDIGGSDSENSLPILEEEDGVREKGKRSKFSRRLSALSITVCLVLITGMTAVTLLLANSGSSGASKCPFGF